MKKILESTAVRLMVAIIIGSLLGGAIIHLKGPATEVALQITMIVKHLTSQIIFFMVPLIILGCVAPSITRFSGNVGSLLGFTLLLAYLSSIGAALFSIFASRAVVPELHMVATNSIARELPEKMILTLNFPTVDTMSTLLFAMLLGLGVVWTRFKSLANFLEKFQTMILTIVRKVLLPILPFFVGSNFALITYKGQLGQMQTFIWVVLLIVLCQFVWMFIMYLIASIYSRRNGWLVAKYYPKAYFTALGTMSSAATLPFALECIAESPIVKKDTADFALPLFSNLHLCGSVIAEMSLVSAVYYMMFGSLPNMYSMLLFAVLACVIAIGSPGVPGGLNMSCITILGSLILVDQAPEAMVEFFGIMTAIYTIQDSFGTACNVTTDGALALMTDKYLAKKNLA